MPTAKHKIMLGDILPPLNNIITDLGKPVNLASYTPKFRLLADANTVVLNDVTAGVTVHPTQAFTLDSTNNWIYAAAHGAEPGDIFVAATSGSLSGTGLTAAVRYIVTETDLDWFRVSLRSAGANVTIAGAGTGTHTFYIVGSIQMDFSATEVDTAGTFKGYWRLYSGSEISTFPKGQGEYIPVEVAALG